MKKSYLIPTTSVAKSVLQFHIAQQSNPGYSEQEEANEEGGGTGLPEEEWDPEEEGDALGKSRGIGSNSIW